MIGVLSSTEANRMHDSYDDVVGMAIWAARDAGGEVSAQEAIDDMTPRGRNARYCQAAIDYARDAYKDGQGARRISQVTGIPYNALSARIFLDRSAEGFKACIREATAKRRLAKINGRVKRDWRSWAMLAQRGRCAYCDLRFSRFRRAQGDHVVPISAGGKDDPGNLVLCCAECNWSKSDLDLDDWGPPAGINHARGVISTVSSSIMSNC